MAKDEGIGMGTGLKETVPVVTEPVIWCTCKAEGTCIGCLIFASVRTNFGLAGVRHLRRSLRPAVLPLPRRRS